MLQAVESFLRFVVQLVKVGRNRLRYIFIYYISFNQLICYDAKP